MLQPTQIQMFWKARENSAALNKAFLEAVEDGLTAQELRSLIKKRPEVYNRFAGWIEKLP